MVLRRWGLRAAAPVAGALAVLILLGAVGSAYAWCYNKVNVNIRQHQNVPYLVPNDKAIYVTAWRPGAPYPYPWPPGGWYPPVVQRMSSSWFPYRRTWVVGRWRVVKFFGRPVPYCTRLWTCMSFRLRPGWPRRIWIRTVWTRNERPIWYGAGLGLRILDEVGPALYVPDPDTQAGELELAGQPSLGEIVVEDLAYAPYDLVIPLEEMSAEGDPGTTGLDLPLPEPEWELAWHPLDDLMVAPGEEVPIPGLDEATIGHPEVILLKGTYRTTEEYEQPDGTVAPMQSAFIMEFLEEEEPSLEEDVEDLQRQVIILQEAIDTLLGDDDDDD
jgi:hypothetical protein